VVGNGAQLAPARRSIAVAAAILVVDDEPGIADALAMVLSEEGHTVYTAQHGAEAVAMLTREPVDLILTDVMMPMVDGLTLVRHLRRRGDQTPVVLMSAAPLQEKTLPGVPFVSKPFDIDNLLDVVADALNGNRPYGEFPE
jgi:CheY-like chemotaxis protein